MSTRRSPTYSVVVAPTCCLVGSGQPQWVTAVSVVKNTKIVTLDSRVHINPPGSNDSRYAYIPFDVPPRAVRISVSYKYDRANNANTIDIGLFDARGTGADADPRGFRGWSGGRCSEFFLSRNEATPGYMPGEMPMGTWRIILGLYKVAPSGADVFFKIAVETDEGRLQRTEPIVKSESASLADSRKYQESVARKRV